MIFKGYDRGQWHEMRNIEIYGKKEKDKHGYYFYKCRMSHGGLDMPFHLYQVGFEEVPKKVLENLYIRGDSMFDELPFDDIKEFAEPNAGYPNYQIYKDNTGDTYCSSTKMKSHAEGKTWVTDCLNAHPGTSCKGKPWTSNKQKGIIW